MISQCRFGGLTTMGIMLIPGMVNCGITINGSLPISMMEKV